MIFNKLLRDLIKRVVLKIVFWFLGNRIFLNEFGKIVIIMFVVYYYFLLDNWLICLRVYYVVKVWF